MLFVSARVTAATHTLTHTLTLPFIQMVHTDAIVRHRVAKQNKQQ